MYLALTGGGTAGHVTPNLAVIERLPRQKFLYIGSKSAIEQKLLQDLPRVEFKTITTGKLRRYFDFQNFIDFFKVPVGIVQSIFILHKYKPSLLFSKGGYVSLPPVIAAWILRIPVIIHESDSIPGLTTKISSIFATQIWATYPTVKNYFPTKNIKQVNLPIRNFLRSGNKNYFEFADKTKPTLLVMGGSSGAGALNDFIFGNFQKLVAKFNILHVCGKGKLNASYTQKGAYLQFEYLAEELPHAYAAADAILSRAGAGAVSEIVALHSRAILVPLPKAQSRGEQFSNAYLAEKESNCLTLEESKLNFDDFINAYETVMKKEIPTNYKEADLEELFRLA